MVEAYLKDLWSGFVEERHVDWTWTMLRALYSEPHRAYHNLSHIYECQKLAEGAGPIVTLALFWHDAVYVPGDKRNEILSAKLLDSLQGVLTMSERDVTEAKLAIEATQHHERAMSSKDIDIVMDIDISVLGRLPTLYDVYVMQIRIEYKDVSDEAWRHGRSAFLESMLAREHIFKTPYLAARFERHARDNMQRELNTLQQLGSAHVG